MSAYALGREAERQRINHFLDGLVDGYRALVLEGEVGVGKTTLLREAREAAEARGYTVLPAHPAESETPLGFAALIDLLGSVDADVLELLPAPQRRALAVALFREDAGDEPPDPGSHAAAVLAVLRILAGRSPVVVMIDDLPLLDPPTARVLTYATRRLDAERIGLIGAVRTNWSGDGPPVPVVESAHPHLVDRLKIGPLSLGAVRELVVRHTSAAPSRQLLLQIHEASGGNPLFVIELARTIGGNELPSSLDDVRFPRTLDRLMAEHLASVPSDIHEVLLLSALALEPTTDILAKAGEASLVERALHHAVQAGIIEIRDGRVNFVHPLVRSALLRTAEPRARRVAHRRLAAAVTRSEERARHLALGTEETDEMVAAQLEHAAISADNRGACEMAAELAELAASLTPDGDKASQRRRVALAAECHFESLDPDRAKQLIEEVAAACPPGAERAAARLNLVKYLRYLGASTEIWESTLNAAREDAGDDRALVAAIRLALALTAANAGDLVSSVAHLTAALELAEELGDLALQTQACGGLAYVAFQQGEGVRRDLVDRALMDVEQPRHVPFELRPASTIGHLLHWADDLDGARRLYELEYARLSAQGAETTLPMLLWALGEVELWAGNWSKAEEVLEEGYQASLAADNLAGTGFALAIKATLLACRGALQDARAMAEEAIRVGDAMSLPLLRVLASPALGVAALSVGDAVAAEQALGPLGSFVPMTGIVEPGLLRYLPDAIEALIRLGDLEGAATLLDPFESRARDLNRRWALATAGRCRGLWLAGSGESEPAVAALDAALALHEGLGMPFEHARTLLVAGEVRRRARHKRQAVDSLRAAVDIFERLGAPLWTERARSELRRVGVRMGAPVDGNALTAAERRVVEAAISGRTNAEISRELFMAKRTVETHLTHAYRKLNVRSRAELAQALADDERTA